MNEILRLYAPYVLMILRHSPSSFRSDSRATNLNPIDMDMQIVLHPGMWEYGGDSPSPSEDGLDQVGSDTFETSTMSFDSHLGIDNSSLDGTVDLTTSMSEISFRMRNIANFESSVSLGGAEAPRLFKLKKETVESNQTSETVRNYIIFMTRRS